MSIRTTPSSFHQASTSRSRGSLYSINIHSPILSRTTSQHSHSSRSAKGDIPQRRSSSSFRHSESMEQTNQPNTPTPRKPLRRKRTAGAGKSNQRQSRTDGLSDGQTLEPESSSEDDQALFDLLGVPSPAPPSPSAKIGGLLTLSKEGMDEALGKSTNDTSEKRSTRSTGKNKAQSIPNGTNPTSPSPKARAGRIAKPVRPDTGQNVSDEGDGLLGRQRGGKTHKKIPQTHGLVVNDSLDLNVSASPQKPISGITAGRKGRLPKPANQPAAPIMPDEHVFDVASLSRSLPTGGFSSLSTNGNNSKSLKGLGKVSEDESTIWDMPIEVGKTGSQELTWQQKLQNALAAPMTDPSSTSSPKKPTRLISDRKGKTRSAHLGPTTIPTIPSPLNPKPTHPGMHNRRLSLDTVPHTTSTSDSTSAGVTRSFSAFDSSIPYHVGMNVNRPPQTPAKPLINKGQNTSYELALPILSGEFPRLKSITSTGDGGLSTSIGNGSKYAGPTFHNSPHAGTLPKPDLNDF